MRTSFADQVVLVTGGNSGFGLAIARAFAGAGAKVVLAARNIARLEQSAAEIQGALALPCDVSKRDQVDGLISATVKRLERIDILVNNAGSGLISPVDSIRIEDAIALFQTNFFGAFNCTQAVLPFMKQQQHGYIVNMSSVAGLRGIPNSSVYSASKAALIAFSDALRIEVRPFGIFVTTLCPSRTNDTAFLSNAKKYGPIELYNVPNTLTTPMVVKALFDAIERRKPMVILPLHARLLHTLNKFAPSLLDRMLSKNMPTLSTKTPERV